MSADDVNNLATVLGVTAMVAAMVLLLPWADRKICAKLGVSLTGGLSANPGADRLLRIRRRLLTAGILAYLCVFAYLVFFSRTVMTNYTVHVAPLQDLRDAFSTDHGFSDVFRRLFTEGPAEAFRNVKLVRPEDLIQFYLNIMVFIPLGYLLPYVFRWFRERVRIRPVLVCFLISFMVENLQLMSRRGLYDLDDMIANTLGGFIGEYLYISFAYMLTHPAWKKTLRKYRVWRRTTGKESLYPFRSSIAVSRTVLRASDPEDIMDFYILVLGYRLVARLKDREEEGEVILLQLGRSQAEFRFGSSVPIPEEQHLSFYTSRYAAVRDRVRANGIKTEPEFEDPCTDRRGFSFSGPDHVKITVFEEI